MGAGPVVGTFSAPTPRPYSTAKNKSVKREADSTKHLRNKPYVRQYTLVYLTLAETEPQLRTATADANSLTKWKKAATAAFFTSLKKEDI